MTDRDRRSFLGRFTSGISAIAISQSFGCLGDRIARAQKVETVKTRGPLLPTADATTGLNLLKLPEGFEYLSYGWTNQPLDDGTPTPGAHDGMAVIQEDGDLITLCRNHELGDPGPSFSKLQGYDRRAAGGCTTLVFDAQKKKFISARASLTGTVKNCAGGASTWNSWLSCEESVAGPETEPETGGRFSREHGYVFDVPVDGVEDPKPIKSLGRFVHEALAIDPESGIVYLTEDRDTAGLYRMVPDQRQDLHAGGAFQMLAIKGVQDCGQGMNPNQTFDTYWVDIDDRDRAHSPGTQDCLGVYRQGLSRGGLNFARLEGCAWHDGKVFITATSGGDAKAGQVWEYDPAAEQLKLLFESPSNEILDMPDNMTVSPRGGILLCEDGDRVPQRLQVLTEAGTVFPFADNNMQLKKAFGHSGDFRGSEWAGATFSGDGTWLFVNLQSPGVTFAITGPWSDVIA